MKNIVRRGILMVILGLGLAGCSSLPPPVEDQSLKQAVMERLDQDILVRRQVLSVSVQNGVVTLRGTITDEALRLRAKSIVQSTPGVVEVQDQTTRR